jgi:hypothetical protein
LYIDQNKIWLRLELTGGEIMPIQNQWSFCFKCAALFFNDGFSHGVCPKGGRHDDEGMSADYFLPFNEPLDSSNVNAFSFCFRCRCMFFRGDFGSGSSFGVCPAGGPHDASMSGDYVLNLDRPQANGQPKWVVCVNCKCLHHGPEGDRACAAAGDFTIGHNPGNNPLFKLEFAGE